MSNIYTHQRISQLSYGLECHGYYILSAVSQRMTKDGKPYLFGILTDASSSIQFVMWNDCLSVTAGDAGKIVYVDGIVHEYKDTLQIKADMLCLAIDDDIAKIQMSDLVPSAPIDISKILEQMEMVISQLSDSDYYYIAYNFFLLYSKALEVYPAAKSIHHAFVGGWLMHTWNMMCMAKDVYDCYKDTVPIDYDLLIAGTFLHDIGKLQEFNLSEQHLVKDYSTIGRLLGHPTLGVMMVKDIVSKYLPDADPEKVQLLQHVIASHHGTPEYGAAIRPQTVEAAIVHYLDGLDSRVEIFRSELSRTPVGKFSEFSRALERSVYNHKKTA